jgi:hypothetical protein
MRQFMNILNEDPRRRTSPPAPIDTSGLKAEIIALMRAFSGPPCHLQFKRDWANRAKQRLEARKASELEGYKNQQERYGDETEPFQFDYRDYLPQIIDDIWKYNSLYNVRANIEHAHDEYQQRAAERHGFEDNDDNYIESSDYLSGMHAMEQCANKLQHVRSLADPRSAQIVIRACQQFLAEWDRYENPSDGGEAPILDEDFTTSIERVLPLMLLVYS